MTCGNKEKNKKGNCCECVTFHRKSGQISACFFDAGTESTYDRSIENFIRMYEGRKK